jgi:hypothetical protein
MPSLHSGGVFSEPAKYQGPLEYKASSPDEGMLLGYVMGTRGCFAFTNCEDYIFVCFVFLFSLQVRLLKLLSKWGLNSVEEEENIMC